MVGVVGRAGACRTGDFLGMLASVDAAIHTDEIHYSYDLCKNREEPKQDAI